MRFSFHILYYILVVQLANAQSYYATSANNGLFKITINEPPCSCSIDFIGDFQISNSSNGLTFTPDTTLVMQDGVGNLYELDTLTCNQSLIFTPPPGNWELYSLVSVGNGVFYGMSLHGLLYRLNTNSGSFTYLGDTGIEVDGDLTLYNGNIYFAGENGIYLLDSIDLSNSQLVVSFPPGYYVGGITPSHICNSFVASGGYSFPNYELILINIIDGSITPLCNIPADAIIFNFISSILEFTEQFDCEVELDLDCNDSSGATQADFNSPDYNCLSIGVGIADEDIRMTYDSYIATMEIRVTGFVPDAPHEVLISIGGVPNIDVDGSGTDMITLTNSGGAKSTDFKTALHSILYRNNAIPLTPGPRTVEVQFTTESGVMSNVATAFIDVLELPILDLDLGPDQQACEGENTILDAGNPGA